MTADRPIAPPPELVTQWYMDATGPLYEKELAIRAAQWGADQELEACCEWVAVESIVAATELRAARRPKPPNLKEQALAALLHLDQGQHNERCLIIRRALEALPDE
jgi:hypothetical protein